MDAGAVAVGQIPTGQIHPYEFALWDILEITPRPKLVATSQGLYRSLFCIQPPSTVTPIVCTSKGVAVHLLY